MLQHIRDRAQGWIAKVIVALIAITFTFFGVESIVSVFTQDSNDAATVNGESISKQAVNLQLQRGIRSGQIPPDQEGQARSQILDQLITRSLLRQYAEEHGLVFTRAQADQLIVQLPEFQDQNNHFSKERFVQSLNNAGFSPGSFRRQLEDDMLITQLQQGLAGSSFVLPSEVKAVSDLQNQTRTFRYALLGPDDLNAPVSVSDEDITAYYKAHQDQFMRPQQVRLNYLLLDRDALASRQDVSDDALEKAYQAQRSKAPKRVSDIVISINDERTAEQAHALADDIEKKLADGGDFAALARQYSSDKSSADKGGDLGVITEGIFGDTFDRTVSSLSEGDVSAPVKLDNAYHILRVTHVDIEDFDSMKAALRKQVQKDEASSRFDELAQKLKDESYSAPDLKSVAEALNLPLKHSEWLGRNNDDALLGNQDVMEAAFSQDVLNTSDISQGYNSDVIELDDDHRLVIRVADWRPEETLPQSDVAGRIRTILTRQRQQAALKDEASRVTASLKAGKPVSSINWQQADSVGRQSDQVDDGVLKAAFTLPHPDSNSTVYAHRPVGQSQVIIGLSKVGSTSGSDNSNDFTRSMAERVMTQSIVSGLTASLRDKADITK
ncbi:SurA N-terminal domain-containing protein [Larsenimonas rhizosphaerae]|uniref:Periplasmic chaperone PpiD n=1 Tax=Larsenimonas rhizosphaerae TaxID=2944682 RepID=A0AA41ZDY1_9GAMM|nr:SurA N-terminal domain-containing protein [Larsenimonas rhizosphaerae]MCX2523062.1 SurA N-terminal domain-containing protein [Larsenimonas rhizosphaerae]